MEIYLALVVGMAVIFFGALISLGNERQRKAIDALREQTELWAIQDLRIKREGLAHTARVDDPLAWLNQHATRAVGLDLNLQVEESFTEPRTLLCRSGKLNTGILFSPLSPREIRRLKSTRHNRLVDLGNHHPLLSLPRNVSTYEISAMNAGIMFDLELPVAWEALTGQNMDKIERIWLFIIGS